MVFQFASKAKSVEHMWFNHDCFRMLIFHVTITLKHEHRKPSSVEMTLRNQMIVFNKYQSIICDSNDAFIKIITRTVYYLFNHDWQVVSVLTVHFGSHPVLFNFVLRNKVSE